MLVRTKNGFGTGSLLKDNTILTNRHVVADAREIIVIFKPSDPSGKPNDDEVVRADVIKLDVRRDLALLRPASIPFRTSRPLDISADISVYVGTDVVAIGHPTGEAWTLTKGIVSAFRPDYEWSGGPDDGKHEAELKPEPIGTWGVGTAYLLLMPLIGSAMSATLRHARC